jgi:DNA-directed RNA polymerase subunit RPC12/RpoP
MRCSKCGNEVEREYDDDGHLCGGYCEYCDGEE